MPEFRIQRCLGRGGFGEVYKGVMGRGGGVDLDVAVKVLRPDLDPSSQGVQRLRDEGRLLGRLTHPTILRVYDLVVVDGRAALITEYVEGDDLGRLLRTEPIPARASFEVIAQVAAALDAAWSWPSVTDGKALHLVHRDIKPDNIRIDPHGGVKLLDFGIAQAQSVRREAHTSVNTIMGSTQYLAPERLVQQEVGPESDVFALGCTLFEALAGEALFARKSMRQMYMLMVDEVRFEQFLGDRCETTRARLGGDRAAALVRAMTTWRKSSRPTAAEVAARCDMISDSSAGLTLNQWCRARTWPPPAEMSGPLDGLTFATQLSLDADTDALPAPQPDPPTDPVFPPNDDTTDGRLRTEEHRDSVLGELDHDPNTEEVEVIRTASIAAQGWSPWSDAEMVAVFSETSARRLARPRARPSTDRIPQLLRQRPPGPSTARLEPAAAQEPTLPLDTPSPFADGTSSNPTAAAESTQPLEDTPGLALGTVSMDPLPNTVETTPNEPTRPTGEQLVALDDRRPQPGNAEEPPTVRIRRRVTAQDPVTVSVEPSTGPISDGGAEPELTLRGVRGGEATLELAPEARERTHPGPPANAGPPADAVDEVQRSLGPEPPENTPDPVQIEAEATDPAAARMPRDVRLSDTPVTPALTSDPKATALDASAMADTLVEAVVGADAAEASTPRPVPLSATVTRPSGDVETVRTTRTDVPVRHETPGPTRRRGAPGARENLDTSKMVALSSGLGLVVVVVVVVVLAFAVVCFAGS